MIKRIIIRNKSKSELGVMLEPWTDREDIDPNGQLTVEAEFSEDELIIDVGDDNFLSIWSPPRSTIKPE
jgi:hypothetical protein